MRLLACTVLALQGCGGEASSDVSSEAPSAATELEERGRALFAGPAACSACHGGTGGGTMLGPSLQGIAARWSAESLAEYLADPAGYAARHPEIEHRRMPQPAVTDAADLAALAAWTLRLMGA
jgi:mono/diheme cytochrome c family protein